MENEANVLAGRGRRMAALVGLGFASGLPNALAQDTLKAWLTQAGVGLVWIGMFGLVGWPYVFKFLWAPALDRFALPWLGRRRGWLLATQAGLAAAFCAMAFIGAGDVLAEPTLRWMLGAGLVVVFLSASQDIVADAYRADVLPEKETGFGAAVFVMGYRIGMIASGAGVLYLAGSIGWPWAYGLMSLTLGLGVAATLAAPEPPGGNAAPATMTEAVVEPVRSFVRWRGLGQSLLVVLFVFLFRLPDVLGNAMTITLLNRGLGYDMSQIATMRQLIGFFITILGALVGGGVVARIGLVRSLWLFGVLQAMSNLGFWWLTVVGKSLAWLGVVVGVESFCGGLVAAGFVGYLMVQCDRKYSAAQYALLSAVMAAPGPLLAPLTGWAAERIGFANYFLATVAAGVPGMALLWWVGKIEARRVLAKQAWESGAVCRACGYDLRGSSGRPCPECGAVNQTLTSAPS